MGRTPWRHDKFTLKRRGRLWQSTKPLSKKEMTKLKRRRMDCQGLFLTSEFILGISPILAPRCIQKGGFSTLTQHCWIASRSLISLLLTEISTNTTCPDGEDFSGQRGTPILPLFLFNSILSGTGGGTHEGGGWYTAVIINGICVSEPFSVASWEYAWELKDILCSRDCRALRFLGFINLTVGIFQAVTVLFGWDIILGKTVDYIQFHGHIVYRKDKHFDASNFSTYRRKSTLTMTKKNCHPTSWHWTTLKTSQCNSLNTVICFAACWRVVMERLYLLSCYDVMRKIPKFEWARSHHQNICLQSLTAIGDECHLPIVYINRWVVANGP